MTVVSLHPELRKRVRAEEFEMKINSTVQHQSIISKTSEDSTKVEDSKLDLLFKKLGALEQQMSLIDSGISSGSQEDENVHEKALQRHLRRKRQQIKKKQPRKL